MSAPAGETASIPRALGDLWVQDCRMTILATGEDTAGQLGVVHIVAPAGHEPPLHVHHDEDEAYYLLSGRMSVRCGKERIEATPGSWTFLPRGIPHNIRVLGDEPARILAIYTPAGFEAFFADQGIPATGPGLPAPAPPDLRRVGALFARHHVEPAEPS